MPRLARAALTTLSLAVGVVGCGEPEAPAGGSFGAELVPSDRAVSPAPAGIATDEPRPADPAVVGDGGDMVPADLGDQVVSDGFEILTDRTAFSRAIGGKPVVIGFDDVQTPESGEAAFDPGRYRDKGVMIHGEGSQYAGRSFGYPGNFIPVSKPNTYAPGPTGGTDPAGVGGNLTEVTFVDPAGRPALVSAFGAAFVDVNYPSYGKSALVAFDAAGREVARTEGFKGRTGRPVFVGVRAIDSAGKPAAKIATVRLITGSGWPGVSSNEGVTLDDLTFAAPLAAARRIVLPPKAGGPTEVAATPPADPDPESTPTAESAPALAPSRPSPARPSPSEPPSQVAAPSAVAKATNDADGNTVLAASTGREPSDVAGLAYSPDGRRLASATERGEVILWERAGWTGRQLLAPGRRLDSRRRPVRFTADGRRIFAGSLGHVDIFDAEAGRLVRAFGSENGNTSGPPLVSVDGSIIVTATQEDGGVERFTVWSIDKPLSLASFTHKPSAGYTSTAALTPDGATAVVLDGAAGAKLFDLATGAERKGVMGPLKDVSLSPDGATLATVDLLSVVRFWDISRPEAPPRLFREGPVESDLAPVFFPGGKTVAIRSNGWTLVDAATWQPRGRLSSSEPLFVSSDGGTIVTGRIVADAAGNVRTSLDRDLSVAAVSPEGAELAVGGDKGVVTILPLSAPAGLTLELARTVPLGTTELATNSSDHDTRLSKGAHYLGYGRSGRLRVVDLNTGKATALQIYAPAWSFGADGMSLYAGSSSIGGARAYLVDGAVRLIDRRAFETAFGPGAVMPAYSGIAVSPDGRFLAAGLTQRFTPDRKPIDPADMFVLLDPAKNPDTVPIVATLAEGFAPKTLAFSPDSKRLAADDGSKLRLWDLTGEKPEEILNAFKPLYGEGRMWFTADGKTLIVFGGTRATAWDIESGQLGRMLDPKAGHVEQVSGMAVSPAAPVYATYGARGELLIKSLDDDKVLARAAAGDGTVAGATFSADGHTLVSLGSDGGKDVVKIWRIQSARP